MSVNNGKDDIDSVDISNDPMTDKTIYKSDADIGKLYGELVKYINHKPLFGCLYPNCDNYPISSHSIQRSKIQKKLCDDNRKIIVFKNEFYKDKLSLEAKYISINDASTAPMFCNQHDTSIFSTIENNDFEISNDNHIFLYSYRAFTKGYYDKLCEYKVAKDNVERLKVALNYDYNQPIDKYPPLLDLAFYTYSTYLGYFSLNKIKRIYDNSLINNYFNDYVFRVREISLNLPIAVCSAYTPDYDFEGRIINSYYPLDEPPNYVFLNVFPERDKTYMIVCYLKKQASILDTYADELMSCTDYENRISETVLKYIENFVISPDHWSTLRKVKRKEMLRLFSQTIRRKNILYIPEKHNIFKS